MNKKYSGLIAIAMIFNLVFASSAQALTNEQEQARLKVLWNLNSSDALTIAQFIDGEASVTSIIDQDIALLEKDSEQALRQKASAEAFISRIVPNALKTIAITSGFASVAGFVSSAAGFYAANEVWSTSGGKDWDTSGNSAVRTHLELLQTFFGLSPSKIAKQKLYYLTVDSVNREYNGFVLFSGVVAAPLAVASLVLAGICKYTFSKSSACRANNAEYIQAKQDQLNRNQVIIAKLKQIKYDNGL